MGGFLGGLPKPVVGREVAIGEPVVGQALDEQGVMPGFLRRHGDPIVVKGARQVFGGETDHDIPGEIDRIELYMGQGVEQGTASLSAAGATPRQISGAAEFGARRTRWTGRGFRHTDR